MVTAEAKAAARERAAGAGARALGGPATPTFRARPPIHQAQAEETILLRNSNLAAFILQVDELTTN